MHYSSDTFRRQTDLHFALIPMLEIVADVNSGLSADYLMRGHVRVATAFARRADLARQYKQLAMTY